MVDSKVIAGYVVEIFFTASSSIYSTSSLLFHVSSKQIITYTVMEIKVVEWSYETIMQYNSFIIPKMTP